MLNDYIRYFFYSKLLDVKIKGLQLSVSPLLLSA